MKVLVITGDKNFGPGNPRFALQAAEVEAREVGYMGRRALWPKIPAGIFDVVTAQDPFWRGLFGWLTARRVRAKLNIQVHTDLSVQRGLRYVCARFLLRRADSVRVVSEKIKQQVADMGVRAAIHVLPIFVDIAPFKQLTRQPHDKKTILWIGRFEPEKDPALAVQILKEVRRASVDAKLIMLGAGSLEKSLRNMTIDLPVEYPGWQNPCTYLQVADVVLCTSKHESYGASIVEALAAGVPVIAPDVGVAKQAGATVVARDALGATVAATLTAGTQGMLRMPLLTRTEWVTQWKESLI